MTASCSSTRPACRDWVSRRSSGRWRCPSSQPPRPAGIFASVILSALSVTLTSPWLACAKERTGNGRRSRHEHRQLPQAAPGDRLRGQDRAQVQGMRPGEATGRVRDHDRVQGRPDSLPGQHVPRLLCEATAPADQLVGRRFLYGDNDSIVSGGRIVSSPGPGVYLVAFADRESEVLMRLEDMIGWEFLPEPTPTLAEISDLARDRHSSTRRMAAGGLRATESARPVVRPRADRLPATATAPGRGHKTAPGMRP